MASTTSSSSATRPMSRSSCGRFLFLLMALGAGVMMADAFTWTTTSALPTRHPSISSNGCAILTTAPATPLFMARPGQSEAQAKREREDDIRSQLARLKSAGKMKDGKGDQTMMAEAEAFLNQESPVRKFERKMKAIKDAAAAAAAAEEENKDTDDATNNSRT